MLPPRRSLMTPKRRLSCMHAAPTAAATSTEAFSLFADDDTAGARHAVVLKSGWKRWEGGDRGCGCLVARPFHIKDLVHEGIVASGTPHGRLCHDFPAAAAKTREFGRCKQTALRRPPQAARGVQLQQGSRAHRYRKCAQAHAPCQEEGRRCSSSSSSCSGVWRRQEKWGGPKRRGCGRRGVCVVSKEDLSPAARGRPP